MNFRMDVKRKFVTMILNFKYRFSSKSQTDM